MPRGRTGTKKSLEERRLLAFDCFSKGMNDVETAKRVHVTRQTINSYRRLYEVNLHNRAVANPTLLRDVLLNTIRSLEELDRIRADAWIHLEPRKSSVQHECGECGNTWREVEVHEVSDQQRAQYHNVLLKSQDQRAKLYGVLGVKQEVLVAILQIKAVQDRILEFMQAHLCEPDRDELMQFLQTPEMIAYQGATHELDAVDVESIERVAS